MPNRYIRASAIESEPVNSLTWQAEVFYRRLLNRVDDFGRYTANADLIRAAVFPLQLDKVSTKDIVRLLNECEDAGLVFSYESNGKRCIVMNKWENGRAKHSEYPDPPENICKHMKTYVYTRKHMSPTPTPTSDTDAGSAAEGKPPEPFPEAERPGISDVRTYAQIIGLAEWKAVDFFDEMEGCNWRDYQNREIRDWRAIMRRVKTKWEADGRPNQPPTTYKKKYKGQNI